MDVSLRCISPCRGSGGHRRLQQSRVGNTAALAAPQHFRHALTDLRGYNKVLD